MFNCGLPPVHDAGAVKMEYVNPNLCFFSRTYMDQLMAPMISEMSVKDKHVVGRRHPEPTEHMGL